MFSAFIHRRPLLRALLVWALFVGLLGTSAATHIGLTPVHVVAASVDAAGNDMVDNAPVDSNQSNDDSFELGDSVSTEDVDDDDMLHLPDGLSVPRARLPETRPLTAHAVSPPWHASSELRPPIV